jgi:prepilin-type N-terminal cleavage/methylation domain-containing protein
MKTKKSKKSNGFTLVEILFALFIGGLLVSAIYFVLISGQKSSVGIERKVAAQGDVRAALEIMALEISMASYNPLFATGFWRPSPAAYAAAGGVGKYCDGAPVLANPLYKGIQEATPDSILVEMDIVENGDICRPDGSGKCQDDNEVIRYVYDWSNGNECITRETSSGGDQPFLGRPSGSPGPRNVRVINHDLGIPVFRYFNAQNPPKELSPDTDATAIPNIRRIDITLAIETDEIDPSTRAPRQMIYSTSVIPRNHTIIQ